MRLPDLQFLMNIAPGATFEERTAWNYRSQTGFSVMLDRVVIIDRSAWPCIWRACSHTDAEFDDYLRGGSLCQGTHGSMGKGKCLRQQCKCRRSLLIRGFPI